MPWVYDPHSGGTKIPPAQYEVIRQQAEAFAKTRQWYLTHELILRFRNQFCYLDGRDRKEKEAFPLGRLRYIPAWGWTFAFYTYGHERYEPCIFPSGQWEGTLEEAIEICEMYLC